MSHGCLCITCGEHLAFKKKKVCMGMCVCLHAMFVYLFDARNLPWGSLNKQKKKYSVGRAVVMSYCDN